MYKIDTKELVVLYNSGLSTNEIGKRFGISGKTVGNRLKYADGVTIRKPGSFSKDLVCIHCGNTFIATNPNNLGCKDCIPNNIWATKYCKWGITKPQFDKMIESQSGLCDLCELPLPKDINSIHVDHCHKQGHVRALLHSRCNRGLGFIENDKFLANAIRYIERHKK